MIVDLFTRGLLNRLLLHVVRVKQTLTFSEETSGASDVYSYTFIHPSSLLLAFVSPHSLSFDVPNDPTLLLGRTNDMAK
jgi:hypothetical protein